MNKVKVLQDLLDTNLDLIVSLWGEAAEFTERIEAAKAVGSLSTVVLKILAEMPQDIEQATMPELTLLKTQKAAMVDFLEQHINEKQGSSEL